MARSKGCRPLKKDRAEVARLRARLAECHEYQWIRAGAIYDNITSLCRVSGPSGGKMNPRACKYCHYYGHTSQHCVKKKDDLDEREAAEWRALQLHEYKPLQEHEVTPERWQFKLYMDRIHQRANEAQELGLGCDVTEERTAAEFIACTCAGCAEWRAFMAPVHEAQG